jgi:hypothetical protein
LRLRGGLLHLLLGWRARLEWLLLGRWLLLELTLLPRIARELRLLREGRLLLLLPETLRLARIPSELWLHGSSSKACRLSSQSALEAPGLAILLLRLLLLLAVGGLPRSGAVAAP